MAKDARGDSWRIATHSRDCYCCCCRCSHKEARTKSLNRFFFCSAFYLCRLLFRLDIDRHGINWGSWKEWNRKSVLGNGMQSIVCVWEVGRATWVEGREFRKNLKRDVCERWQIEVISAIRLYHHRVSKVHSCPECTSNGWFCSCFRQWKKRWFST